jgi:ATP-dependent protease ClpP protease subunit
MKTDKLKEADLDDLDLNTDTYKLFKKTLGTQYDVYLSDTVEHDGGEYIQLLRDLEEIEKLDILNVHLANFGGSCHTGLRLCHAIKNCKAGRINMIVEAPCYSMGAILAVVGHSLTMAPGTFLMFHNYTSFDGGKAGELKMSIDEYNIHWRHALKTLCYPFLTKKELNLLHSDKDLYIREQDKPLLLKRSKRHFKKVGK